MPLPAKRTSQREKVKICDVLKNTKTLSGLNFEKDFLYLAQWRQQQGVTPTMQIPVTIQLDAFAVVPKLFYDKNGVPLNGVERTDKNGNKVIKPVCYGHEFLLVPMDKNLKATRLFVLLSDRGTQEMRCIEILKMMHEYLSQNHFTVINHITDGDDLYRSTFGYDLVKRIKLRYVSAKTNRKVMQLLHLYPEKPRNGWTSDPIHIGKRIRKRFLKYWLSFRFRSHSMMKKDMDLIKRMQLHKDVLDGSPSKS